MSTEKFRRQLRDESRQWREEGLIDPPLYDFLAQRYQFSQIETASSNRFIAILLGLGGILLGLGAITFVAANWQDWSRTFRVFLLLAAFLGINSSGFYLWQHRNSRWHRLGQGLLLTGVLLLGANLGLMSQMFHQSGPLYGLFGIWSLGTLLMAYGLRLTFLGVSAWILLLLGYWNYALTDFGDVASELGAITLLMRSLPLLITPLFLPLAHQLRSRVIFGLWSLSFALIFPGSQSAYNLWGHYSPFAIATSITLPPALLWVYRSDLWQRPIRHRLHGSPDQHLDPFQSWGQSLSLFLMSWGLYWFSFRFLWRENPFQDSWPQRADSFTEMIIVAILTLIFYGGIMLYGGWQCYQRDRFSTQTPGLWLKPPVLAGVLAAMYGFGVAWVSGAQISIIGPVIMNGLLFGLSLLLLHDGLLLGLRRRFWGGMLLLVLALISRIFEYNTALVLKAIVLILCGLGIIAAGLWFERRTQTPVDSLQSLPGVES